MLKTIVYEAVIIVQSGFKQRKEQKINGKSLLSAFFMMTFQGKNTLERWAAHICNIAGAPLSRQAVWKRIKQEINLYKELQHRQYFDKWVILGLTKKVKVRLIAVKLPAEQAEYRRRKAKNNRDTRIKYHQHYLEMLDYNVFITSELQSIFSSRTVAKIYGLRWRIENIFKCWKSHFHLERMVPKNCSL